jgi:hypothetical protein
MVKPWIIGDYLRQMAAVKRTPGKLRMQQASNAIRVSDDKATQALYEAAGGDSVMERMMKVCGLTDTTIYQEWWSLTRLSARDGVRLGECVADGRAAGPKWTKWLLTEMTKVRGTTAAKDQPTGGRWGIIDGLPKSIAGNVSIKNGWTRVKTDRVWNVNCLAIADGWVLSVLTRYPDSKPLDHGAGVCKSVAQQLAGG